MVHLLRCLLFGTIMLCLAVLAYPLAAFVVIGYGSILLLNDFIRDWWADVTRPDGEQPSA